MKRTRYTLPSSESQNPSISQRPLSGRSNVARIDASLNGLRARGLETCAVISMKSYASSCRDDALTVTGPGGRAAPVTRSRAIAINAAAINRTRPAFSIDGPDAA
jgi:hypothetical protein